MKIDEEARLCMIEEISEEVMRLENGGVKTENISVELHDEGPTALATYPYLLAIKYIAGGYWQDANAVDIDDVTSVIVCTL